MMVAPEIFLVDCPEFRVIVRDWQKFRERGGIIPVPATAKTEPLIRKGYKPAQPSMV